MPHHTGSIFTGTPPTKMSFSHEINVFLHQCLYQAYEKKITTLGSRLIFKNPLSTWKKRSNLSKPL